MGTTDRVTDVTAGTAGDASGGAPRDTRASVDDGGAKEMRAGYGRRCGIPWRRIFE